MERLAGHAREVEGGAASALDLLDRVWSMHPDERPGAVLACALEAQVRHLSLLPVGSGWMMRFLRDLPTFIPTDAPIPDVVDPSLEEDVVYALALRCASHAGDGEAIHRDAVAICTAALTHLTPGTVCRISVRAYQQTRPDAAA